MKLRDLLGTSLSILGLSLALTACSLRPVPEPTPTPAVSTPRIDYSGRLQISEVMVKNTASVLHDGGFPDWVELVNVSGGELDLSGWALSDRAGKAKLALPAETLGPGEYRVVFCGEDSFSLSGGETLFLLAPSGKTVESLRCEADEDRSLERREAGTFAETVWISPGFPNGAEGYDAWCGSQRCPSPVQIAEVMVCNRSYPPAGREWFEPADWVELVNTGDTSVELAGMGLSDRLSEPGRWRFPAGTLAPGERVVVYCDADSGYDYSPYWNTGFSLSSGGEALYLSDSAGEIIDYVNLHDIPIDGSAGRMAGKDGFFYFTEPTPGDKNAGGERRVSALPVTEEPDGVYEGVSANVDTQYNLRAYRSAENGSRWTFAFYDLDWSLMYEVDFDNLIYYGEEPGNHGVQLPTLLRCLSQNAEFRQRVIERYAVLRRDVLNNERLLERIDYYAALLEPEIERSQSRWWLDPTSWRPAVNTLRDFVVNFDWENHNLDKFCRVFHLSDAERAQYFGP